MKFPLVAPLIFSLCGVASAAEVTYTATTYEDYGEIPNNFGFNLNGVGEPQVLWIPQFNGPLSSVTFTFSDSQVIDGGISNNYGPDGIPYTLQITGGDMSTLLGLAAQTMFDYSGISQREGLSTGGGRTFDDTLSASGSVAGDLSAFEGTSSIEIPITPTAHIQQISGAGQFSSGVNWVTDDMTLQVSYTAATPEPSLKSLVGLVEVLLLGWVAWGVNRKRSS